jgi:cysteine desulfurase
MLPFLGDAENPSGPLFGNPSSAHSAGRRARKALEDSREQVADLLGAFPDEVIFTSGATESNNLALFGLAGDPPIHVLASPVEHPSVVEPLLDLARRGCDVEWLPVRGDGRIAQLPPLGGEGKRSLATIQLVNHETGVVQLIRELCSQLKGRWPGLLFHCDAAQAVGKFPISFHDLGIDALTASAHKFHGPKGLGLLLLRRGTRLRPMLFGGHQQQGKRPGTEPVALVVGLAAALATTCQQQAQRFTGVQGLRDRLSGRLLAEAGPGVVNGACGDAQSPYTLNISFPGIRAEVLLMKLDLAGVACSTGSACSSGSLLPSPVLKAMGVPDEVLHSAMRFSFGPELTATDIDEAADRIIKSVRELRQDAGDSG